MKNNSVSTKKKIIIAIAIVLAIAIATICINAVINKNVDSFFNETTESRYVDGETVEGKLGSYICTVKSAEKCTDYKGRNAVKITYIFTNNTNDTQSFDYLTNRVYQNKTQLETTFIKSEKETTMPETASKESSEISLVYVLNDQSSKLNVELEDPLEYNGKILTYEVEI